MKQRTHACVFFNGWLFLFLLMPFIGVAQQDLSGEKRYVLQKDSLSFERYCSQMETSKRLATGDLMVGTARFFLGKPYVGGTLEIEPEKLVVNLSELDCLTLVENVMALTWTVKQGGTFLDFQNRLKNIRYRQTKGEKLTYVDRLHYTSDWIYENEKRGLMRDVTQEIGGKPYTFDLSFMSTHPDSYKQLKGNPDAIAAIVKIEKEINTRTYFYIPQEEICLRAKQIRQGDIICFVTTIKGLDISHLGIACWLGDTLTFIHASSDKKQVIVNDVPLDVYVQNVKRHCGVIVLRPMF